MKEIARIIDLALKRRDDEDFYGNYERKRSSYQQNIRSTKIDVFVFFISRV